MKFNTPHIATLLASLILLGTVPAQAAINTYTFNGALDSGALIGETFSGQFSFDDSALHGTGSEYRNVNALNLVFHGQTFTQTNAAIGTTAEVAFNEGIFVGLGFTVESSDPAFSFISGLTSVGEAAFAYQPRVGNSGFGSLTYTLAPVPEPETYALFLAGLGWVGFAVKRSRSL